MTSLITALFFSTTVSVAAAHPNRHPPHAHGHRHHQIATPRPAPPPPRANRHLQGTQRHGYWVYPHSNSAFMWRWKPGHFTRRGVWVPGHWSVVLRLR